MTVAVLLLGPGVLGLALVPASLLPTVVRRWAVLGACTAGVALGGGLVWAAGIEGSWRTATLGPASSIAGAAAIAAWLVVAALDSAEGRWEAGALVGVASSGLALAASNRWVVPWLLFWALSSLALAGLAAHAPGRSWTWLALVASDVALGAGVAAALLQSPGWALPFDPRAWGPALVAAAVLRSGALPRLGAWALLGGRGACALPLVTGGSFALLSMAGLDERPWEALGLLLAGLGIAGWEMARRRPALSGLGAWPLLLMLSVALAAPRLVPAAGVAAVLASSAVALWPFAIEGAPARGLVLSLAPPTAAFWALAAAAHTAFERAVATNEILARAPWVLLSALLPVGLAAGVVLGARAGRQTRAGAPPPRGPAAATWGLAALSVAALPTSALDAPRAALGSGMRVALLGAAAVAGGAVAGVIGQRKTQPRAGVGNERAFDLGAPEASPRLAIVLSWVCVLLAVASALGLAYLTFAGLRAGFL